MPELFSKKKTRVLSGAHRRSLLMHTSHCTICRHPQRAEIERDFLDWAGPRDIARDYDLGSHTTVYRHAHAMGLFARRERSVRFALGRLIEQVDNVRPTAASIVSAIRLMVKLNDRSEYAEEPESAEDDDTQVVAVAEASATGASAEDESANRSMDTGASGERSAPAAKPPAKRATTRLRSARTGYGGRARTAATDAGKDEKAKEQAAEEEDGEVQPMAFAPNVRPWRRFFWR